MHQLIIRCRLKAVALLGGRNFGLTVGGGDSCPVLRATHCQEHSAISLPPNKAIGWAQQSHFTDEKSDTQKGQILYLVSQTQRTGGAAQLIKCLFNLLEALGSIPSGA